MRRSLAVAARAALAACLAACAPAVQRVYVAPSDDTVTTTLEESAGSTPSHVIYVTNNSSVPIVVFSVSLRDCENIKQRCEPHPMNVTVPPGARHAVYRVEARDANRSFGFRYGFSWRPAEQKAEQKATQ